MCEFLFFLLREKKSGRAKRGGSEEQPEFLAFFPPRSLFLLPRREQGRGGFQSGEKADEGFPSVFKRRTSTKEEVERKNGVLEGNIVVVVGFFFLVSVFLSLGGQGNCSPRDEMRFLSRSRRGEKRQEREKGTGDESTRKKEEIGEGFFDQWKGAMLFDFLSPLPALSSTRRTLKARSREGPRRGALFVSHEKGRKECARERR